MFGRPNNYSFTRRNNYSSSRRINRRYVNTKTSGLRCTKSYLNSDKTIDINKTKKYNKFLTSDTINALNEYTKAKKDYDSTGGWLSFSSKSCKDYINIRDSKERDKNKDKINNCNTYQKTKIEKYKTYINGLSTSIKTKITKRLTNVLINPDEKNMTKLACYIQLLIDLSKNSGNNILSIDIIINNFSSKYQSSDQTKKNGAIPYIKYLLTNANISDGDLSNYKKWYKKDTEFIKAFENAIKDYPR